MPPLRCRNLPPGAKHQQRFSDRNALGEWTPQARPFYFAILFAAAVIIVSGVRNITSPYCRCRRKRFSDGGGLTESVEDRFRATGGLSRHWHRSWCRQPTSCRALIPLSRASAAALLEAPPRAPPCWFGETSRA